MSRCSACKDLPGKCEACRARNRKNKAASRARRSNAAIERNLDTLAGAREFATPDEDIALDALLRHGTVAAAARELGLKPASIRQMVFGLKRRAARHGYAPEHDMTRTAAPGFHVHGTSTYYFGDKEAGIPAQWVKNYADKEDKRRALIDAARAAFEDMRGAAPKIKPPKARNDDLLCVYPIGDAHFGMHAWGEEAGEDFDLKTAERQLFAAVDELVELSPPAATALIVNVGDFIHADNRLARTERGGHNLDVDTRWPKVLRVAIDTLIRVIVRALERHDRVRIINAGGNHDPHSALMLSVGLDLFFRDEKRVEVDMSPAHFHYYRHGKCLFGVHHGHGAKPTDLGGIMSVDRREDWGETLYRHWYTGHIHHDNVKDLFGCTFESIRTLAARDAWHAGQGYRSERDMKCDVWHREFGRQARTIRNIRQIRQEV